MESKPDYRTGDGQKNSKKAIWVDELTHRLIKQQAARCGVTIKEYVAMLAKEKAEGQQ